jgi:hypothetical protein
MAVIVKAIVTMRKEKWALVRLTLATPDLQSCRYARRPE